MLPLRCVPFPPTIHSAKKGAEAQGDTGLQVEQRGRIEKSLEDFRQGSDEMESSFLKDQIGFYTENSFGGGWGWRGQAG